jgi:hypothetical protein
VDQTGSLILAASETIPKTGLSSAAFELAARSAPIMRSPDGKLSFIFVMN